MSEILYALRYALHQWRVWILQARQCDALADYAHADAMRRDARARLSRATAAEVAEKLAFDQYRRVLREVAR